MRMLWKNVLLLVLSTLFSVACDGKSVQNDDAGLDANTDAGMDCGDSGVWHDTTTDLCWQEPPSTETMTWYVAAGVYNSYHNPESEYYCSSLGEGWRLPTISELRSLIRGCPATEWNTTWTEAPDEAVCGVCDGCLMPILCSESDVCQPAECDPMGGPGADGCYWDVTLRILTCSGYWSSSQNEENSNYSWFIDFTSGHVRDGLISQKARARCVR